jgi:O-antigen/teichoic acid export membrane protein
MLGLTRASARSSTLRGAVRRPAVRRSAWAVVDQGLSGLTNFAVTIVTARSVDSAAFGAFSMSFVVYALLVAVTRAVVAQPLAIRFSSRSESESESEVAAAVGAAAVGGVLFGSMMVGVGVLLRNEAGTVLALVGFFMPALLVQDVWRFVFFTNAKPKLAVVNDLVWTLTQLGLFAIVLATGASVGRLAVAWGAAALTAAAVGIKQAGVWPSSDGLRFLRRHRDLGGSFAIEVLFEGGSTQVAMLLLGAMLGTPAVGAIRGCRALFAPFNTVLVGLVSAVICEGGRLQARRAGDLYPAVQIMSALLGAVALACGLILLGFPTSWGRALLGATWPAAREVLPVITLTVIGTGLASGAVVGLRVLAAARTSMWSAIIAGIVAVTAAMAGGAGAGLTGGAWGLCLGAWVSAVVGWWLLVRLYGPAET